MNDLSLIIFCMFFYFNKQSSQILTLQQCKFKTYKKINSKYITQTDIIIKKSTTLLSKIVNFIYMDDGQQDIKNKQNKLNKQYMGLSRDKKYRILKSMVYKYEIPIKSVLQPHRQDNFISYSIVNKVSNTGWFSNQRLLVLDSRNKELFYMTKIPDYVLDQDSPLQIQMLAQSKYVKERVSLSQMVGQVKSVRRQDKMMVIQWEKEVERQVDYEGSFKGSDIKSNKSNPNNYKKGQQKIWMLEMTSVKLAQDWCNLIEIIQKNKLASSENVRKIAITPQLYPLLKTQPHPTQQITSTPKSVTDINSIHMKSEYNISGSKNNPIFYTPVNKKNGQESNTGEKYFKTKAFTDSKDVQKVLKEENFKKQKKQFKKDSKEQRQQNYEYNLNEGTNHHIQFSQLINQFPNQNDQNSKNLISRPQNQKFSPLSQQLSNPIKSSVEFYRQAPQHSSLFPRKNTQLYRKYGLGTDRIINQEQQSEKGHMLSEQMRYQTKTKKQGIMPKQQNILKSGISKYLVDQEIVTPRVSGTGVIKRNITPTKKLHSNYNYHYMNTDQNVLLLKQQDKNESPNHIKNGHLKSSLFLNESPQYGFGRQSRGNYRNTYSQIKQLPQLQSNYSWNEIYFSYLIEYFNHLSSYNITSLSDFNKINLGNKNKNHFNPIFIREKIFQTLWKLQRHVQKFQKYCARAVEMIVDEYILRDCQKDINNKRKNKDSRSRLIKVRQEQNTYQQENNFQQSTKSLNNKSPIQSISNKNQSQKESSLIERQRLKMIQIEYDKTNQNIKQFDQISQIKKNKYDLSVQIDEGSSYRNKSSSKRQFNKLSIQNQNQKNNVTKYLQFQFEGIQFSLVLGDRNNMKNNQLQSYPQSINTLFKISHIHPSFSQLVPNNPTNYFHLFTPMISKLECHGLIVNCKAIQSYSSKKYTEIGLDHKTVQKQKKKFLNLNRYIKQRLQTALESNYNEPELINYIKRIHLCRQLQRNNYLVVTGLIQDNQHILNNLGNSITQANNSYPQQDSKGIRSQNKVKQNNLYNKKSNNDFKSTSLNFIQNFIQQHYTYLSLLLDLYHHFNSLYSTHLLTHLSFSKILHTISPEPFIHSFIQLAQFYAFLSNQIEHNKQLTKQEKQQSSKQHQQRKQQNTNNKYLIQCITNRQFLKFIKGLIQNEIVINLIKNKINQQSAQFIRLIEQQISIKKEQQNKNNNLSQISIFEQNSTGREHRFKSITDNKIRQRKMPQYNTHLNDNLIKISMKSLFYIQSFNQQQQIGITIKDYKSLNPQTLDQMILQHILTPIMNEMFLFIQVVVDKPQEIQRIMQKSQKQINQSHINKSQTRYTIKLNMDYVNTLLQNKIYKVNQNNKQSHKITLNQLDINVIYEGVMHQVGVQEYMDPLSQTTQSFYKMTQLSKSPKNQLFKLIQSPYKNNNNSSSSKFNNINPSSSKHISQKYKEIGNNKQENKQEKYFKKQKQKSTIIKGEINQIYQGNQNQKLNQNNSFISPQRQIQPNQIQQKNHPLFSKYPKYIRKLFDSTTSEVQVPYHIRVSRSLKQSYPLREIMKQSVICNNLTRINKFILNKQFNKAIEIYYLVIQSENTNQTVFYKTFKEMKYRQQIYEGKEGTININKKKNSAKQQNQLISTPSLMTYLLATQAVAFSFIQLFSTFPQIQFQQAQQYLFLALRYNNMSSHLIESMLGYSHVMYLINQLIYLYISMKNRVHVDLRKYLEQAQKCIQSQYKHFKTMKLTLVILTIKAKVDLKQKHYRTAIQTIRMVMDVMEQVKNYQPFQQNNDQDYSSQYWIQSKLCKMFQKQLTELNAISPSKHLQTFSCIAFQLLAQCNENDPNSQLDPNRQKIKLDIVQSFKLHLEVDTSYIRKCKMLWGLIVKNMTPQQRQLIQSVLLKLYDKLIHQMGKQPAISSYNIQNILNPLGKSTFGIPYLFAYRLFYNIFANKSWKYWHFLLHQFNQQEIFQFRQFLYNKMALSHNQESQTLLLQHYDLKRELFKQILLMMKLVIMVGERFTFQTIRKRHK